MGRTTSKVAGAGRDVGIRRQVEHRVEVRLVEQRPERGFVEDIELDELKCRLVGKVRDIAAASQAQIVHAPDLLAPIEQAVAKMAADESGAAGD
jgi:hypothetical protein